MNWQAEGNCSVASHADRERFFSEDPIEQALVAEEYCYDCPVRSLCLQTALDFKEYWGVWGGATQEDLRDALCLDDNGRADKSRLDRTICPKCSQEDYKVLGRTKLGFKVSCINCDLNWETRARLDG